MGTLTEEGKFRIFVGRSMVDKSIVESREENAKTDPDFWDYSDLVRILGKRKWWWDSMKPLEVIEK